MSAIEADRRASLIAAEERGLALLDAIEHAGFIAAGRNERDVEQDIRALAADSFGASKHWHKRIVRAGPNTLATAGESPPFRDIASDDIVFLDLGPVFDDWEADVGRSYAIGSDPAKHALVVELPRQFDAVRAHFLENPGVTGAALYDLALSSAQAAGWRFGGTIAGHIVGEFPHAHWPGYKPYGYIRPENDRPLRDPDAEGRTRYWILEIHLTSPDGAFGGFYERLMLDA